MKKGSIAIVISTAFLFLGILFISPAIAQSEPPVEETPPTEETITIDEILQEELPEEFYNEMFSDENLDRDFELYFGDEKYFKDEYLDEDYGRYHMDDYYYPEPTPHHSQDPFGELIASIGIIMFSMVIWFFAMLCFAVPIYIYYSLTAYTIGKKLKVEGGWMAWVPILNMYYNVKLAGLEIWWFLLYFVPFVNIFAQLYVWMKIAGRRGFEEWIGLLMIVPFVNFFIPGYLAWGEPSSDIKSTSKKKPAKEKDVNKV